jgi:hypothetical protein
MQKVSRGRDDVDNEARKQTGKAPKKAKHVCTEVIPTLQFVSELPTLLVHYLPPSSFQLAIFLVVALKTEFQCLNQ